MTIFESIIQLDKAATLWINNLATPATDSFWWLMSATRPWFPVYIAIGIFALWKLGWKRGLALILTVAMSVVVIDQGDNLVKATVARLRPCFDYWMNCNGLRLPYGLPTTAKYGFFSAHAGNSFGFAAVSYFGFKWYSPKSNFKIYGWVIFLWATFMSISRIMMGAHFLGDILAGAVIGFGIGYLFAVLARKIVVKAGL